jgi:hypothetical protein
VSCCPLVATFYVAGGNESSANRTTRSMPALARAPDDPTPAFAALTRGPQVGPSVGGAAGVRALSQAFRVSLLIQVKTSIR